MRGVMSDESASLGVSVCSIHHAILIVNEASTFTKPAETRARDRAEFRARDRANPKKCMQRCLLGDATAITYIYSNI
jgi:hypothetical protein